jgi:hypothetical protein
MKNLVLGGLGFLLFSAAIAAVPMQKQHAMKVGKRGEITLTQATKAGDKVLQPGTYVVQHRISGSDHFVRFVELKEVELANPSTDAGPVTYTEAHKAGEIPCKVEPATAPIEETVVYTLKDNGVLRITKVAIKGESVWHIL